MATLWTPHTKEYRAPKVSREHWETMLEWEAQVREALHWEGGILEHWNRALADIDPMLRLAQAGLLAQVPGVLPGFYHLVRLRDPASATFMAVIPLTGPRGEYAEPSDAMLRGLRAADLQNPRAVADRDKRDRDAAEYQRIDEARDDMDRVDLMTEKLNAITRTQVSMTDVPWAQNAAGARRPTKGKGT